MYSQRPLPYAFEALEPYIDARTMEVHYTRHHAGYVAKLNKLLEGHGDLASIDLEILIADLNLLPEELRQPVRDNAGGHLNHSMFWEMLSPEGGGEPMGSLSEQIRRDFGSYANFQNLFTRTALDRFGSGWGWLVVGPAGRLEVISTANQDSPIALGSRPVLGIDLWEHAYYLKYQNRRADYVEAFWHVVNWAKAAEVHGAAVESLVRVRR